MGLVSEFREFALKGNVIDLAVGVIIGGAFGGVTKSMVDDLLMPPLGKLIGNLDFTNLYISLSSKIDEANAGVAATTQPAAGVMASVTTAFNSAARLPLAKAKELGPVIAYGNFITIVINFVIIAFVVFLMIKLMNTARRRAEAAAPPPAPPPPTKEEQLLGEIRDLLRAKA